MRGILKVSVFKAMSPDGEVVNNLTNRSKFARIHGLHPSAITECKESSTRAGSSFPKGGSLPILLRCVTTTSVNIRGERLTLLLQYLCNPRSTRILLTEISGNLPLIRLIASRLRYTRQYTMAQNIAVAFSGSCLVRVFQSR